MKPSIMSRDVTDVALALCDGFAGSRRDEFKKLIANEDWDTLVQTNVSPSDYPDAESYFADAASIAFLKKYEGLPTTIDKAAKARSNFWTAEASCYRANQRLLPFIHNTFSCEDEALVPFLDTVREKVVELIGERPPSDLEGRFGPGATYGDRRGLTTIPDKMQSRPQLTHDAWPFLVPWSGTSWCTASANRGDSIDFVRGNRFTTVPKDGKTDRGISIEPSINLFYQLALGSALRKALKKRTAHRVDLEHSQATHRQVAREASVTGAFATIDLSQASDSICSALVRLIIPPKWFDLLDSLRSPFTEIREDNRVKVVKLEKFSSMGNGYTFELETVIFMAICCAVMHRCGLAAKPGINVYTFGDDMIVPTECAQCVIAALSFLGFKTNVDKTFVSGPFRESCGGDYFLGVDVRPYYQKKHVSEPQHYIGMANGIRRMAPPDHYSSYRWDRARRGWFIALDAIPSDIRRCRGPQGLGDICIHDEKATWETKWRHGIRYIRTYRPVRHREVKFDLFDYDVQLASALYGITLTPRNGVIPRDSVLGYKIGWVASS